MYNDHKTHMAREIAEMPEMVARQLAVGMPLYHDIGKHMQALRPVLFATNARGSSDHAAKYFKYVMESKTGIPVVSMGPSLGSIYNAPLKLKNAILLTISQSGGSPDLLKLQQSASRGGAITTALLNVPKSVIGKQADFEIPILAGEECAVAATKSFIASLVALVCVYAHFNDDQSVLDAVEKLPDLLGKTLDIKWDEVQTPFGKAATIFTIGRGPGLALAEEAALKIKETCGIHAEAFSSAEILHGPMTLVRQGVLALAFIPDDESQKSVLETVDKMRKAGALVYEISAIATSAYALRTAPSPHPLLAPILQAASFYQFIEKMSLALGENPDNPPNLSKVTKTL